ncbi:MAG: DUF2330 domain-containing protein [Byssovorax sp.]
MSPTIARCLAPLAPSVPSASPLPSRSPPRSRPPTRRPSAASTSRERRQALQQRHHGRAHARGHPHRALPWRTTTRVRPENSAMVVPDLIVLSEENVKTLPAAIFDKVDKLASPRLVEYWEQDPCAPEEVEMERRMPMRASGTAAPMAKKANAEDLGVTIEAEFTVGEYQIVILSAKDSLGLDTWLRQEKYNIPAGSEPLLRPYVAGGSKFFVAKVDVKKVRFENGMAQLSPLRFHYDTDTFALPVRLGMVNSAGTQDLIVHILARGTRYETSNFANVAIPTNLDVKDEVRQQFGAFYAALFDRTMAKHPGASITEYSWDAGSCDPCPGPTLTPSDLGTLGADVIDNVAVAAQPQKPPPTLPMSPTLGPPGSGPGGPAGGPVAPPRPRMVRPWRGPSGFVLTRLHLRYGKSSLGEDLVFRAAPAIAGGREFLRDGKQLETGAVPAPINNFQARYAIRHPWTGPVNCQNPRRGIWGGPPAGQASKGVAAAQKIAFAPRGGISLPALVARDSDETSIDTSPLVPAVGMFGPAPEAPPMGTVAGPGPGEGPPPVPPPAGGCAGCEIGASESTTMGWLGALGAALAGAVRWSRKKKAKR